MERQFYTDDFEQLLKEKSDELRMYPSKRVWHSIYNDLHPGRKWPSVAVSMLLIIALFITGYWNNNTNASLSASITSSADLQKNPEKNILSDNKGFQYPVAVNKGSDQNTTALLPDKNSSTVTQSKNNKPSPDGNSINPPYYSKTTGTVSANGYTTNLNKENYNDDIESKFLQLSPINISTNSIDFKSTVIENVIADLTFDKPAKEKTTKEFINEDDNNSIGLNAINIVNSNTQGEKTIITKKEDTQVETAVSTTFTKTTLSTEDKAWIEDYALHNKSQRSKWKDRVAFEFYITPGVGYRKLSSNAAYADNISDFVIQKPGLGIEAGTGLIYAAAKNLRLKAGIQANYTNYVINAVQTNHPVLTTLLLKDPVSGYPNIVSRQSTLSNPPALQPSKAHNKTYQISIPVGFALKLSGNDKLEWYAGATLQPTFVIGGKANLLSHDKRNYISDPSLLRHWSLNSGFETYIHYKLDGYTLQVGPQFRYQLVSTYSRQFSLKENLYNTGLKIGVIKNF